VSAETKDPFERARELRAEADRIERDAKKHASSPVEQRIAEALHSMFCHWNHIDGCGWEYESWERPGWSRDNYLKKARKTIENCTELGLSAETVLLVLNRIIESLRTTQPGE
jgi:hypothetical protein